MKTRTKFLLSIAFIFTIMLFSRVYAGTIGDLTYTIDTQNKTATIVSCKKSAVNVTIPSKVESNRYTVTTIEDAAFKNCEKLKSVTIPSSVTDMGSQVFLGCKNLTTVTNNSKITFLPYYAFSGCTSLTTVNIPSTVTKIGFDSFENCTSLKSISIPKSVKEIGDHTFDGCKSLTNVTMTNSVEEIGWNAFQDCVSLATIKLSDNLKTISRRTFSGCTKLSNITMPSKLNSIEYGAFEDCKSLKTLTVPSGAETVITTAFDGCSSLTQLVVPKSVQYFTNYYGGDGHFEGVNSNFKMYVEDDSPAYEWAVNHNIKYKIITPGQVKKLKATAQTANSITYKWNAVSGATGYKIYTYNYSKNKWEYYGKTTSTSATIKSLKPSTVYKIKVRAYKNINGTQYFGNYSTAVKAVTKPKQVTDLKATTRTSNTIKYQWSKLSGVTGYKIYIYNYSTNKWEYYGKTKDTSVTLKSLKSNTSYKIKVRAYKTFDGTQYFGSYSTAVRVKTK